MPEIIRFQSFGGPENLKAENLNSQQPGPGEVLLRMKAVSINRDHFSLLNGQHFSGHGIVEPDLPSRIGYEGSGIVEAVGDGVDSSWIGKMVSPFFGFDETKYGLLGQEAIIPAGFLSEYPSNLTAEQAASFWVPYLTAYGALISIGSIGSGDFISIPAGSSSVGLAAIQIARDKGATTIAITRTNDKKEELLSLGADHVIVLNEEDYENRIKEITNGVGVRITFDPIGGPFLIQLAEAAAVGGIIIEYGLLSGQPAPFLTMAVIGKGLSIRGYTVSEVVRDPVIAAQAKQYILDRLANGVFVSKIAKTFTLDQIVDAYNYVQTNEQIGRVVISIPS